MRYKRTINQGIAIGLVIFVVLSVGGWFLIPGPKSHSNQYWLKWLFLYSLPMLFGVLVIVLRRYGSPDLIKGGLSTNEGIEVERAYLQNTVEQTLIVLPMIASFGAMAPVGLLKVVPLHAFVFIVGRILFYLGYTASYAGRIPGFTVTNYANIALLFGCLYLVFTA